MASSAKDIQLRELKDTVSQLKTMIAEQTELIKTICPVLNWYADGPDRRGICPPGTGIHSCHL